MVIYPINYRIPVKLGTVTVWISPLSWGHKQEILNCKKLEGGVEVDDAMKRVFLTLKYSMKSVDGLTNPDGSPYVLTLDTAGNASEDAISDLMQMDGFATLIKICATLMGEIKDLEVDGVKVTVKDGLIVKKS